MKPTQCTVDGCRKRSHARRMCKTHYERNRKHGAPGIRRPDQRQALESKIEKTPGGCWRWTGTINDRGYGMVWDQTRRTMRGAHRVTYENLVGQIPDGDEVDHVCRNRGCVNPEHLRIATHKQNAENRPAARGRSGVRGVSFSHGKWVAQVTHHGVAYRLGEYDSIAEAEEVVVQKRNELFTHNDADRAGRIRGSV